MNRIIYFLIAVLAPLMGCSAGNVTPYYGPEIHKKIKIDSNITKIRNNACARIDYYQSSRGEVELTGPEEIVKYYTVREVGSTLSIDADIPNTIRNLDAIHVKIGLPKLNEFTSNGVGYFKADKLSSDMFILNMNGVGDVDIKSIDATLVKFNHQGVSDMCVGTVESTTFNISSNGVGNVIVKKAHATDLEVAQNGTGNITIDKVDANKVYALQTGTASIILRNCIAVTLNAIQSGTGSIILSGAASTAILTADGMGSIDATGLKTDRVAKKVGEYARIKM
ncbi:MAG: hypothetical protein HDS23_01290 [Bacteroides sp.]|nr:hypothetical protein [Bacteroidales bacterium]MBD5291875.1 hypothetical protein [Bacteroides sp.]MBD5339832.1 hypothetical protein [Bacteroides sp.]